MVDELYNIRFNYINKGDVESITKASKSMVDLSTVQQSMPRVVQVAGAQMTRARQMGQMLGTAMAFAQGGAFVSKLNKGRSQIISAGARAGKNATRRLPSRIRADVRARSTANRHISRLPEERFVGSSTPAFRPTATPVSRPIRPAAPSVIDQRFQRQGFVPAGPIRKAAATVPSETTISPFHFREAGGQVAVPSNLIRDKETLKRMLGDTPVGDLRKALKTELVQHEFRVRGRIIKAERITQDIEYLNTQVETQATSMQYSVRRYAVGGM